MIIMHANISDSRSSDTGLVTHLLFLSTVETQQTAHDSPYSALVHHLHALEYPSLSELLDPSGNVCVEVDGFLADESVILMDMPLEVDKQHLDALQEKMLKVQAIPGKLKNDAEWNGMINVPETHHDPFHMRQYVMYVTFTALCEELPGVAGAIGGEIFPEVLQQSALECGLIVVTRTDTGYSVKMPKSLKVLEF